MWALIIIPIVVVSMSIFLGWYLKNSWKKANKEMAPFTLAVKRAGYEINAKKKTIKVNGKVIRYNATSLVLGNRLVNCPAVYYRGWNAKRTGETVEGYGGAALYSHLNAFSSGFKYFNIAVFCFDGTATAEVEKIAEILRGYFPEKYKPQA